MFTYQHEFKEKKIGDRYVMGEREREAIMGKEEITCLPGQ